MDGSDACVRRRAVLAGIGAGGLGGVAGCIGGGTEEGERVSWNAASAGGTYIPLSRQFGDLVAANTPHTLDVKETGGSVENVGSLGGHSTDFALVQNDVAYYADNGTGPDEFAGDPLEDLRAVATLYPEALHIVTRAESDIESVADLVDRRVNTGNLGSGTHLNARQVLEAVADVSVDDMETDNTSFAEAAEQLNDGVSDAFIVMGGWPVDAVADLARAMDIELVDLSPEERDDATDANSWFVEGNIPGGVYNGVTDAVETIGVRAMLTTHADVDVTLVESITAAIFDNTDQLTVQDRHIDIESALDDISIDLHQGAWRYFT